MIIHLHPFHPPFTPLSPPFHPLIITDVLTHYAFCVRNTLWNVSPVSENLMGIDREGEDDPKHAEGGEVGDGLKHLGLNTLLGVSRIRQLVRKNPITNQSR